MEFGLLGLIVLALDIYAILKVLGSNATSTEKILWTLGILVLPVAGLIAWALLGPSGTRIIAWNIGDKFR